MSSSIDGLRLRSATEEDLLEIVELWDSSAGPTQTPGRIEDAARLHRHDRESLAVATFDGEVVGTLITAFDGWRCHFYRLAVRKDWRRLGVANQLVDSGMQRARLLGAGRIDAMVDLSNSGGICFWESVGFVLDDLDRRWTRFDLLE